MVVLGNSWRHLGWNLGHLRRVLERLGRLLGGSWEALEASRDHFGSIFQRFLASQAIYENSEKHRKTNGFSLIFEVLEGFYIRNKSKSEVQERFFCEFERQKSDFESEVGFLRFH